MATSGSTDWTLTSRQIVTTALQAIGVTSMGDTPGNEEADLALTHLNMCLKTWATMPKAFLLAEAGVALVASTATYSLPSARRVLEVRRRLSGIDVPITQMSRSDYFDLPDKAGEGNPISWWFDPQRATRLLYVYKVPSAAIAASTTLRYTYQRVIEDVDDLDNDPDVPQEWLEALTYALAARLIVPFRVITNSPAIAAEVKERAQVLIAQLSADGEDSASIFLQPA